MPLRRRGLIAAALAPFGAHAQPAAPLRIGVLTDLSGQYRDNSGPTSVLAARQAVADFRPEQYGFAVEILAADHQQKPDVGAAIARQWFDRDGVSAVADLNNTAIALAVRTQAVEKDRALLISGAASAELTGKSCSANQVHWAPDTWGNAHSTGEALLRAGHRSFFLVVADYVFGHTLEREVAALVRAGGGTVLGSAAYPFPGTTDFSSFLLQAQASGADVVAFCNTGGDMENAVKQAAEFGLSRDGRAVAPMFGFITEMKAVGLPTAQGLFLTETFYWNLNDRTRAFTRRFLPQTPGNYPSSLHASCYSAVTHYLKAIAAGASRTSGRAAVAAMKALPTDDDCFGPASIRADGRFLCPTYLFQVKAPAESTGPWDIFRLVSSTPGERAFRPLAAGGCTMDPA